MRLVLLCVRAFVASDSSPSLFCIREMFEPAIPNEPERFGKRFLPVNEILVSAKLPQTPVGKRVFAQDAAMYHQTEVLSPRDIHQLVDEDSRARMRNGVTLEFTRPQKAWAPVGGSHSHPIPQPPQGPQRPKPVAPAEPSPRLLARIERPVLSAKVQLPPSNVNVQKLTERMCNDVTIRRQKHATAVQKAAENANAAQNRPQTRSGGDAGSRKTDPDEFFRRLVEEPIALHAKHMHALTEKLCGRAQSPRKLKPEEQAAMSARLYREGVDRQRAAVQRAAKKYIDDVSPKYASMCKEDLLESGARLHAGSNGH